MSNWKEKFHLLPFYRRFFKVDEQLIDFYMRDLCDWDAALARMGFTKLKHKDMPRFDFHYVDVPMARGLALTSKSRKLSHMQLSTVRNTLGDHGIEVVVQFGYPFGPPTKRLDKLKFVRIVGRWEVSFSSTDDADLRFFEKTIRRFISFFSTHPFDDVKMLEDFAGYIFKYYRAQMGHCSDMLMVNRYHELRNAQRAVKDRNAARKLASEVRREAERGRSLPAVAPGRR